MTCITDNEKIHRILEYVCSTKNQDGFDTDQIAAVIQLSLSETNILVRQIIINGDAKEYSHKELSAKGGIGLLKIVETNDAFETKKYLKGIDLEEMKYNVIITTQILTYNILNISEEKLFIVIDAYLKGEPSFTISGQKYWLKNLLSVRLFTYEKQVDFEGFKNMCKQNGFLGKSGIRSYFTVDALTLLGKNVTDDFIGDKKFGEIAEQSFIIESKTRTEFVNNSRLCELKAINHSSFDLSKLIQLCNELNDNYKIGNYQSVGMIGRTILNHIPPIFGFKTFDQVANNYGGHSFKKNMEHLNVSLRNIADGLLHNTIRSKETLPNETQVDFRQDFDRLLEEIVGILK